MATVTGITVEKAGEIEDASVVSGHVTGGRLYLVTHGGTEIDAGEVVIPPDYLVVTSAPTTSPGIVNSAAEATLFDLLVPTAKLAAGDVLMAEFNVDAITNLINDGGPLGGSLIPNGSFTLRVKVGATTLATFTLPMASTVARQTFEAKLKLYLSTLTAQRWVASLDQDLTSMKAGTSALGFNADVHLTVTGQMSVAAATNDIRPILGHLTRLR